MNKASNLTRWQLVGEIWRYFENGSCFILVLWAWTAFKGAKECHLQIISTRTASMVNKAKTFWTISQNGRVVILILYSSYQNGHIVVPLKTPEPNRSNSNTVSQKDNTNTSRVFKPIFQYKTGWSRKLDFNHTWDITNSAYQKEPSVGERRIQFRSF